MEFRDFVDGKKEEIETKIRDVNSLIENFPRFENFAWEEYGDRESLIHEYKLDKGKKFLFFKRRISDYDIKCKVYEEEKRKLELLREKYEVMLKQLQEALRSLKDHVFTCEIFPNDFVIEMILEYGENYKILGSVLICLVISLFKRVSADNMDFLAMIERSIAECFEDDYTVGESISLSSLIFMLDKTFKVSGEGYIEAIKTIEHEIDIQYKMKLGKGIREELEDKKKSIIELEKYIVNGNIVSVAPSLGYFKELLARVDIAESVRDQYIREMGMAILEKESKKDMELLETVLTTDELTLWNKASLLVFDLNDGMIKDILKKMLKGVVSVCRYIGMTRESYENQVLYEIVGEKLSLIKMAMESINYDSEPANLFLYLCDNENIPVVMHNVEVMDTLKYKDILDALIHLAGGNLGREFKRVDDIHLNVLEEECVALVYAKVEDKIVILGVSDQTDFREEYYTDATILAEIKNVLRRFNNKEYRKCQEIYENLLVQTLDLREVGYTETIKKLAKIK